VGYLSDNDILKYKEHKKEEKATYRENQKDVAEAKANKSLIAASFDPQ
jgi:hypothetical protein